MVIGVFVVRHMADLFAVRALAGAQVVAGGGWCDRVGWLNGRAGQFDFVCDRLFCGGRESRRRRCDGVRLFGGRSGHWNSGPDGFEFVSGGSVFLQSGSVGGGVMSVWHRGVGR